MMDEIRGTLELFEKYLPEFKPATTSKGLVETNPDSLTEENDKSS